MSAYEYIPVDLSRMDVKADSSENALTALGRQGWRLTSVGIGPYAFMERPCGNASSATPKIGSVPAADLQQRLVSKMLLDNAELLMWCLQSCSGHPPAAELLDNLRREMGIPVYSKTAMTGPQSLPHE